MCSSFEVSLERALHHLTDVFRAVRLVKGSDLSTCHCFGKCRNSDRDKLNLIKHHPLLLKVSASGSVPFKNPDLNRYHYIGSLAGCESLEDFINCDRVVSFHIHNINIEVDVGWKGKSEMSVLLNMCHIGQVVCFIKC
jgi:hypothetical protein